MAALRARIDEEFTAAELGLRGLSEGSARHAVLIAHMVRVSVLERTLAQHVGDAAASAVVYDAYTKVVQ